MLSKKALVIVKMIKAVSGVAGASLILTEHHPYMALIVLAIGAASNEYLIFYKE